MLFAHTFLLFSVSLRKRGEDHLLHYLREPNAERFTPRLLKVADGEEREDASCPVETRLMVKLRTLVFGDAQHA